MNAGPALAVIFVMILLAFFLAGLERILLALFSGRRRSIRSLAQPAIDFLKLIGKPTILPANADPWLFYAGPVVAFLSVYLSLIVMPWGPGWIVRDLNVGLFFFLVLLDFVGIGMALAGWNGAGPYGVIASFRAASQLLQYIVPIAFAAIGPVMAAESLRLSRVVEAQSGLWFVATQPVGFLIYLFAALVMAYRRPFDLPQAEAELYGGFKSELSGPLYAIFEVALYALFFAVSAMGVALYWGGWHGPWLPPIVWFFIKSFILAALLIAIRAWTVRLRAEQLMSFSWQWVVPISLVNIVWVGLVVWKMG